MFNNANRTRNSVTNIVYGLLQQCTNLILSFVSRTVFLHVLSAEYLGINGLFADVLQMLSLADLGFSTAMTFSFYKPLARKDEKTIAKLIHFYRRIYTIIAAAVLLIGIALLPFLKYVVNTQEEIPLLSVYYLFALAGVVVSYLFVYKTALLTADQKNYYVTRVSIVTGILRTVMQIIVLLVFHSYIGYLAVQLASVFLSNYLASRRAEKEYPFLLDSTEPLEQESRREIFDRLKSVFLYKISGVILNATDNLFISVLVSTAAVGLYSNYLMINGKISGLFVLVFGSFTASIGNVIVLENEQKRYHIFRTLQTACLIGCGIIVSCYIALIDDFMFLWLGPAYMFDFPTVLAIALNLYMSCVLQPLWSYREATGIYEKTKYVMLLTALLNVVFSVAGGILFGVKGILAASVLSRLLTYIWYEPYLLFRSYFNRKAGRYFVELAVNAGLIFVMVCLDFYLFRNFQVTGWFLLFVKAGAVGLLNTALFLLLYSRSEGCRSIMNMAAGMIRK